MEDRFVICPVKGGPKSRQPYESIQILDTFGGDKVILERDLYAPFSIKDMEQIIDLLNNAHETAYDIGYDEGVKDH